MNGRQVRGILAGAHQDNCGTAGERDWVRPPIVGYIEYNALELRRSLGRHGIWFLRRFFTVATDLHHEEKFRHSERSFGSALSSLLT